MMTGAGSIIKHVIGLSAPDLLWFALTYGLLYLGNSHFDRHYSSTTIVVASFFLNPAFFGTLITLWSLVAWQRKAARFCGKPEAEWSQELFEAMIVANTDLIDRIESLRRWAPLKGGVYLAFWINAELLANQMRRHQLNTPGSARADIEHKRISEFQSFFRAVSEFVVSLAGKAERTKKSEQLLDSCFSLTPFKTPRGRLKRSVQATYTDGQGFKSTLNFLFRCSLWSSMPSKLRTNVLRIFEDSFPEPKNVGWLGNRFFEYALIRCMRGDDARLVAESIKDHSTNFHIDAAMLKSSDEDGLGNLKWQYRNRLLEEINFDTTEAHRPKRRFLWTKTRS